MKPLKSCLLSLLCLGAISFAKSANVPVLIWGPNSDPSNFPSSSAFGSVSSSEFIEKYLSKLGEDKDSLLVSFIQDSLSMEDMSLYKDSFPYLQNVLDTTPTLFLPTVESPLKTFLSEPEAKIVEKKVSDPKHVPDDVAKLSEDTKILVIYLPPTLNVENRQQALRRVDKTVEAVMNELKSLDRPIVAFYTAKKDSIEAYPTRMKRNILQVNDKDLVLNETCILFYNGNVSVQFNVNGTNGGRDVLDPAQGKIDCPGPLSATVTVDYSKSSSMKLNLVFNFNRTKEGNWGLESLVANLNTNGTDNKDISMETADVWAPTGFSYSCSRQEFNNVRNKQGLRLTLVFDFFQVEVAKNTSGGFYRFSDSFDCSTFFTLPIWMGLFVVILYSIILAIGVYFLFDIRTNDRFDDPKSKPIAVNITD